MSNRRNSTKRPRHKPWAPYLKLPAFLPVPLRTRKDGWTPARQARFIALLAETACVRKAAQLLGLTRESAYRLRKHPGAGSFRAAWDTAVRGKQQPRWKFTPAEAHQLALAGPFHIALHRGRARTIWRKPDDSRLLSAVHRLDRVLGAGLPGWLDDPFAWLDVRRQIRRSV
ncbi:hypothetical protein [Croceibacterium mercuriale]|uniref:hypothetical protein n=1 Tax=Croceibacterium mercuriale TaxID=1572751 RepID=UPI000691FD17|nr:hypothetical protein [Croceibacterium mercuriale]